MNKIENYKTEMLEMYRKENVRLHDEIGNLESRLSQIDELVDMLEEGKELMPSTAPTKAITWILKVTEWLNQHRGK